MSDTTIVVLEEGAIEGLRAGLRGELIEPGNEAYDEARKVYNGMIDKRPRLIARCADVADVISAVVLRYSWCSRSATRVEPFFVKHLRLT